MWNWIKTFAIISQADSQLADRIWSSHFVNVKEECHFNGKCIECQIVLNVPEPTIQIFCRKNGVERFVYCRIEKENDRIILQTGLYNSCFESRKYHKARKKQRLVFMCVEQDSYLLCDSIQDDRLIISVGPYECAFSIKSFLEIDKVIEKNLDSFDRGAPSQIFELANNGVGLTPWYYRNRIYKGLLGGL